MLLIINCPNPKNDDYHHNGDVGENHLKMNPKSGLKQKWFNWIYESQTCDKRSFVLTATFSEQEAQQRHWGGTRGWDFPSALSAVAS